MATGPSDYRLCKRCGRRIPNRSNRPTVCIDCRDADYEYARVLDPTVRPIHRAVDNPAVTHPALSGSQATLKTEPLDLQEAP